MQSRIHKKCNSISEYYLDLILNIKILLASFLHLPSPVNLQLFDHQLNLILQIVFKYHHRFHPVHRLEWVPALLHFHLVLWNFHQSISPGHIQIACNHLPNILSRFIWIISLVCGSNSRARIISCSIWTSRQNYDC